MSETVPVENLHPDDYWVFLEMRKLAQALARHIGEDLRVFEAKRRPLPDGAVGLCYCAEKRISIVFRFKDRVCDGGKWWGKPLPKDYIRDTVAHEVAHLKHPNHGAEFKLLEAYLTKIAKGVGV